MIRPGFLISSLAAASVFFGWQTYHAWTRPAGAVSTQGPAAAVAPIGVAPADSPVPVDLTSPVAYIVARPVFRPDRLPFRDEQGLAQTRNYDSEIARFTLLGVLIMGGDKKGVVVGKGGTGRDERWEVSPGDSLPGFTVKDVAAEGVTLVADKKEFLLPLYAGGPKGQAPIRTDVSSARQAAPSPQPPAGRPGAGAARPAAGAAATTPAAAASAPAAITAPAAAPPAAARPSVPGPRDFGRSRIQPRFTPGRR
jgi:hypothetical protein